MKNTDWKDVGIRALKTFIQAFFGSLVALIDSGDLGSVFTKAAIISALASAFSAMWNGVLNPALSVVKHTDQDDEERDI